MARLLVIEDGHEYEEFARLFLADRYSEIEACHTGADTLATMRARGADALLIDLRFERARSTDLLGDVQAMAEQLFAGDRARTARWLKEQQGTVILAALRDAGFDAPAVFVHDFPAARLSNLKRMYGRVAAVRAFDATAILDAFAGLA